MSVIYVIRAKSDGTPARSLKSTEARKLLAYTTAARAHNAMIARRLSFDEYEVVKYKPMEAFE